MGIQIADSATVLFDSVTGLVLLTPVFEDHAEAAGFLRWTENEKGITDLRRVEELEMLTLAQEWMQIIAEHTEAECPFDIDRDSYGMGFTGESDKHVGPMEYNVMATPDACGCECHHRPGGVFSAEGRAR